MPGPLAAQTAIAIGFFQKGKWGATLRGLAFVLPSFLIAIIAAVAGAAPRAAAAGVGLWLATGKAG